MFPGLENSPYQIVVLSASIPSNPIQHSQGQTVIIQSGLLVLVFETGILVRMTMEPQLENLCDSAAESVEGQVGDRMQIKFAHNIGAVGLSRLYA